MPCPGAVEWKEGMAGMTVKGDHVAPSSLLSEISTPVFPPKVTKMIPVHLISYVLLSSLSPLLSPSSLKHKTTNK